MTLHLQRTQRVNTHTSDLSLDCATCIASHQSMLCARI